MKTDNKKYSLVDLVKMKGQINTQSDYQRPEVWKRAQRQLLIDSILRDYDIPKFYVKKEPFGSDNKLEVIDGQQRLSAIWKFFNGDFTLPKDAKPIGEIECASKSYFDLDMSLRMHFDNYEVDFVIVTEAIQNERKNEIGDLFLRLQNGTPLRPQEKRNAMPGNMRDFIKKLAKHEFFEHSYSGTNTRYNYDQIAAQLTLLEISLERANVTCNIGPKDLDSMYKSQNNFEMDGKTAQKVKETLNVLYNTFPNETPELSNPNVVALYCLLSRLIESYVIDGIENSFRNWFMAFETKRKANDDLDDRDERKDPILFAYTVAMGSSSDGQKNIEKRLKTLEDSFFETHPNIERI